MVVLVFRFFEDMYSRDDLEDIYADLLAQVKVRIRKCCFSSAIDVHMASQQVQWHCFADSRAQGFAHADKYVRVDFGAGNVNPQESHSMIFAVPLGDHSCSCRC
jgi:hypothetical protein